MKLEASYELVTPMFLGGAEHQPELRLASFKGVLRYWWRALAWSHYEGRRNTIAEEEAKLFGSAQGGQARVIMRFKNVPQPSPLSGSLRVAGRPVGEGARYLGYGVIKPGDPNATLSRQCFMPPLRFTIELTCRRVSKAQLALLLDALRALGLLAGLGSKSRKGYGSIALAALEVDSKPRWVAPETAEQLGERIRMLFKRYRPTGRPPYTALAKDARCVILSAEPSKWHDVLNLLGKEMIRYRSKGYRAHGRGPHKILGKEKPERRFAGDHDLITHGRPSTHPQRIAFGLPHNYGQGRGNTVAPRHFDRRASPLFIHIHQCENGTCAAVLTLLPAQFLPSNKRQIRVGHRHVPLLNEEQLYQPVEAFLDRFVTPIPDNCPVESPSYVLEVAP